MAVSLRLRFCRQEPAIWLAHLDMMRTFERSVRRAGIPVAYSGGFNPRPRLSFALPIGVGTATEDDRLDIQLEDGTAAVQTRVAEWTDALNRNLPDGLAVCAGELADSGGPSLMSLVTAAEYRLQTVGLQAAIRQLEARDDLAAWTVDKNSKGKTIKTDIRPLILTIRLEGPDQAIIQVRAGSRQNLRPDLFLQILVLQGGLDETAAADSGITRTRLWLGEEP